MTPAPEPSNRALGESLAALTGQVADLRGQVHETLTRFERLTQLVNDAVGSIATQRQPAPTWIGLGEVGHAAQLDQLRDWVGNVLRPEYGGYQLRDCWANHRHALWELSTLAAEWHRTYSRRQPDLDRALDWHNRWLPGAMRRIDGITRNCETRCAAQTPVPASNRTP